MTEAAVSRPRGTGPAAIAGPAAATGAVAALARAAPGIVAFGLVGALAAADGGYYPTSWGWAGAVLGWGAAAVLVARRPPLARAAAAMLAALGALAVWIAASAVWSSSAPSTALEAQRSLVYVGSVLAFLAVARRDSRAATAVGLWAAALAVCAYALLLRLFPQYVGVVHPVAGYRLSEPIGYWNGLGLLAALGTLLAAGIALRARSTALAAAAAASLVVTAATLLFTFSRGGWLAVAVGLATMLALETRRTPALVALAGLAVAPAFAVWRAAGADALIRPDASAAQALAEGRTLGAELVFAAAVAAVAVVAGRRAAGRTAFPASLERALGRGLALAALAAAAGVIAGVGGPAAAARGAYEAFTAPTPVLDGPLSQRLFTLSGSGRIHEWRVAWDTARSAPLAGTGAGTFEQAWLREREVAGKVRDAHNLYLETLAELGVVGLGLLLVAVAVPLAAAARTRRSPLVPVLGGAYAAFLAHAALDWDWELPALTVAALLAATAIAGAGGRPARGRTRAVVVVAALAVGTASFAGLLGNIALSRAVEEARDGRWEASAAEARRAAALAPWSAEPWRRLALAQSEARAARRYFREAIARDPRNWQLRLEYAWSLAGAERSAQLAEASRLNPLSPELADLRARLAREGEAP